MSRFSFSTASLAAKGMIVNPSEIDEKLNLLDGRGSDEEYKAVKELASLGNKLPKLLLEKYRHSSKWGTRASCVYHAIKYAASDKSAFQLGLEATKDKSKKVRYRACMLLAVAQNSDAIAHLEALINDNDSSEDAMAAIDAIRQMNHNYFVDRSHSGKVILNV